MIVGIGLDVVERARMSRILSGEASRRFVERILTPGEIAIADTLSPRRALEFVCGRFAAKEAVVKAIGCGIGAKVGFKDIEILPDELGKPICKLSPASIGRLDWEKRIYKLHVAITHERSLAAATAIIEEE
ncbi:holo-ACP synthase [Cohnella terricola]|uniref:Holo-[acyl-carrier-protein] synthase n=1 Tax=Cohnella terricola TaxID=1289167 RepID=A0A559JTN1_9BACL|nr:holo-ACP synthase [Cohnella terricola]TVY03235.1 holo-[acyl-carrier-protein] synthase [Cohnella terricola]